MTEFEEALATLGLSEDDLNATLAVQIESYGIASVDLHHIAEVRPSEIHRNGTFATRSQPRGHMFLPVRLGKQVTLQGCYVNHSATPNCLLRHFTNGDLYLEALEWICKGDELTHDYTTVAYDERGNIGRLP